MTAGELLRQARTEAGLSQTGLAARAGVAQSVISMYEAGRRQPSVETLRRLVAATGGTLVLALEPGPRRRPLDGPLGRRLRQRRRAVLAITKRHGIENVRVFGSVARGEDDDQSIDLLVDLPPRMSLYTVIGVERELSSALDAKVDLVPSAGLKQRVRADAVRDAVAL